MVSPEHSPEEGHLARAMVVVGRLTLACGMFQGEINASKKERQRNVVGYFPLRNLNNRDGWGKNKT